MLARDMRLPFSSRVDIISVLQGCLLYKYPWKDHPEQRSVPCKICRNVRHYGEVSANKSQSTGGLDWRWEQGHDIQVTGGSAKWVQVWEGGVGVAGCDFHGGMTRQFWFDGLFCQWSVMGYGDSSGNVRGAERAWYIVPEDGVVSRVMAHPHPNYAKQDGT